MAHETWNTLTAEQLQRLFNIPEAWAVNPKNVFWAKSRIYGPSGDHKFEPSKRYWVDLIAYVHEDDTKGRLFIFQQEILLNKRTHLRQLTTEYNDMYGYLKLNKKELIDTISMLETLQSQIHVDGFESYFSVYDDYDLGSAARSAIAWMLLHFFAQPNMQPMLNSLDEKNPPSVHDYTYPYYLSSYEKTVLKKNMIGIFHFFRKRTEAVDIHVQIGHIPFVENIPEYKLIPEGIEQGMYVNFSILGVMIHLLKQQVPSMIES